MSRRIATESTFRSVRDNQDTYKQTEMAFIGKGEKLETLRVSLTDAGPFHNMNSDSSHNCVTMPFT